MMRHSTANRVVRHTSSRPTKLALWLCLLLGVAGCSGNLPPPRPLTDLTLPKVTEINGITGLQTQPETGIIHSLGVYTSTSAAPGAHVLFALGSQRFADGALYDVGVDGNGLRSLGADCAGVAVTPDGQWVACWGQNGPIVVSLTVPVSGLHPITLERSSWLGNLAWLANGRYLTMSTNYDKSQCALLIYAASPSTDAFRLVGVMNFPEFVSRAHISEGYCGLIDQAWSPDGAWLTLSAQINDAPAYVYAYPTGPLLAELNQATSVVRMTVPLSALISLTEDVVVSPQAWVERDGHPILTISEGSSIVEIDPLTRHSTTLLTITDGYVDPLAWTPDGQHLVFAQQRGSCFPDCPESYTPSHLYVYTP